MFNTFSIGFMIPLAGAALAFVLIHARQPVTPPGQARSNYLTSRYPRHLLQVVACTLLVLLTGCGSSPSSSNTPSPTATTRPSTPLPSSPTVPDSGSGDWPTYHLDTTRAGYLASIPDPRQLTRAWSAQLDGAVYAEPLVVSGRVLVATEGDSLYSLDPRTGHVQWRTNVGTPVPLNQLPCGNIDPLGITGTPVYDPGTGLVFAVAEVSGPAHILVGIDIKTGQVRVRRSADPAGIEIRPHQQRAALALSQNMVYIAYGGLDGDCGNYHGWVVALRTDGQGPLLTYQVPTTREGGIWAASGPAVDADGRVFVAVGNGETTQGDWDHSDSVLRLSPTLQLEDGFAPQQWQQENASDADLGSMGPLLLPGGLVYANGKAGQGYLLHANALGGIDGQAQVLQTCSAFGGAAALGSHLFIPCTSGLLEILLGPGATLSLGWQAPGQVVGSPVVGGHTVYSLDRNGNLYALDSKSGTVIASLSVGQASRFATPTLYQSSVFVGTMTGVTAASIS
jgi:outer membrane protein assembly factor BamB